MNYNKTLRKSVPSFIEWVISKFLSKLGSWSFKRMIMIGIIPRLLLMPFVAHPFDIYSWYSISAEILENGLDFTRVLVSGRPLWFITMTPIAYVYRFLSAIMGYSALPVEELPSQMNPQFGTMYVPDILFNFLVKIPMLITDIATTIVLYRMVMSFSSDKIAWKTSLLYYLNPICIWISAGWGQYESVLAFFTVLSLYFLLKMKILPSALSLIVAILYKSLQQYF